MAVQKIDVEKLHREYLARQGVKQDPCKPSPPIPLALQRESILRTLTFYRPFSGHPFKRSKP